MVFWFYVFFFICTILRMVRWKTVLNFSLKIFLLREIVFVVVVLVVVPLRPCLLSCKYVLGLTGVWTCYPSDGTRFFISLSFNGWLFCGYISWGCKIIYKSRAICMILKCNSLASFLQTKSFVLQIWKFKHVQLEYWKKSHANVIQTINKSR